MKDGAILFGRASSTIFRGVDAECDMRPLRIVKESNWGTLARWTFAGSAKEYLKVRSKVNPHKNSKRYPGPTAQFRSSRSVTVGAVEFINFPWANLHPRDE